MSAEVRRCGFAQGLRSMADLIESDPTLPVPSDQRLLVPLRTNAAVEEWAAGQGYAVKYDDEGNASVTIGSGGVRLHVYGYVDFDAHCEVRAARNAQDYAASHGLQLVPANDRIEVTG